MLNWLKSLFSPKTIIKSAVDALDLAVPFIAVEIEKAKQKFSAMTSNDQAQWLVDQVQAFLRKRFSLTDA